MSIWRSHCSNGECGSSPRPSSPLVEQSAYATSHCSRQSIWGRREREERRERRGSARTSKVIRVEKKEEEQAQTTWELSECTSSKSQLREAPSIAPPWASHTKSEACLGLPIADFQSNLFVVRDGQFNFWLACQLHAGCRRPIETALAGNNGFQKTNHQHHKEEIAAAAVHYWGKFPFISGGEPYRLPMYSFHVWRSSSGSGNKKSGG